MAQAQLAIPELPNLVSILAQRIGHTSHFSQFLLSWENSIFSLFAVFVISLFAYLASRKMGLVSTGRLQSIAEALVGAIDDFICGILGQQGRKYTPFIGTLFIYILFMNLLGLIPFMKSPTASWSTTLGLAVCVFIYVQYTGIKELGFLGYLDHMMGRPRGMMALSLFIPVMMFFLHIISELVRPISLSLRLRGNILGDDLLLTVLSGLGIKGIPFLLFSTVLAIIASIIQAVVFSLLTTIYFTLILTHDEEKREEVK